MTEYTSTNCPTLRERPNLFFVQRFTILKPSKVSEGSIQSQCSTNVGIETQPVSPSANIGGTNCPEEANFLLSCVTSAVDKAKPIQEAAALLFLQVRNDCEGWGQGARGERRERKRQEVGFLGGGGGNQEKKMQNAIFFCCLLSVEILLKTTPLNEKCYLPWLRSF